MRWLARCMLASLIGAIIDSQDGVGGWPEPLRRPSRFSISFAILRRLPARQDLARTQLVRNFRSQRTGLATIASAR